ncbi:MAG: ABC transporter permease [Bryobacteraceae bacterium]
MLSLERLLQDLQYGLRTFLRRPIFAASAVLLLALVISLNTVAFSIVDAVLLRPLPYRDPARIMAVWERPPRNVQWKRQMPPFVDFLSLQKNNHTFEAFAAAAARRYTLFANDRPEAVTGDAITAEYLPMLGIPAARGRIFLPGDNQDLSKVVLSHGLWSRLFAGRDVIGKTIDLNSKPYTIVGVMPPNFPFPSLDEGTPELWTVLSSDDREFRASPGRVCVVGRLRRSVQPTTAESEITALLREQHDRLPASSRPQGMIVRGLQRDRAEFSNAMLAEMSAAVIFLLLVACANIAGLLLSRAAERRHEMAIRYSLGATRKRVFRQLLTENVLLWSLAGLAGIVLAAAGLKLSLPFAIQSFQDLPRFNAIAMNSRAALYAVVLAFVTGALFGLVPALQGSQLELAGTLKEGSRSLLSTGRMRYWGKGLIASEVAVCIVLLLGGGLMLKSLVQLVSQPLGFQPANVATFKLQFPAEGYAQPAQRFNSAYNFYDRLLEKMAALPGVQAVGASSALPIEGTMVDAFSILGHPAATSEFMLSGIEAISPGYFQSMEIPLLAGRFLDQDDSEHSDRVALVNQTFAKRFFPSENPIGKRIKHGNEAGKEPWMTIVGVVGDVKHAGLDWDYLPEIFESYRQLTPDYAALTSQMSFVARAPDARP